MMTNAELNTKFETLKATTNTRLEAMQNFIKAILEETRHLHTTQVGHLI